MTSKSNDITIIYYLRKFILFYYNNNNKKNRDWSFEEIFSSIKDFY